jgi:hypothetical protein
LEDHVAVAWNTPKDLDQFGINRNYFKRTYQPTERTKVDPNKGDEGKGMASEGQETVGGIFE